MADHGVLAAARRPDVRPVTEGDPITRALGAVRDATAGLRGGALADYIPELAAADPTRFGIAVASVGGRVYGTGDDAPFTIQSVSKPFVFALALAELGVEDVLARVGVEPSGEAFNAISLDPGSGRPANPMINAGALLSTSLVPAADAGQRWSRILDGLSAFAGRPLLPDAATYASELATGDRNRALAYLMRAAGALTEPPDEVVDVYVRQCSVLVTTTDLALMAATLAAGGTHPRTGVRVVGEREAGIALAVMATCGMYDHSGQWLVRAGLPAKSGVSGCLVAASPGQFGVGAFSPLVDERGNSVRATAAVQRLSAEFELDLVRHPGLTAPAVVRRSGPAAGEDGPLVLGLQGDLDFAAAEEVLPELLAAAANPAPGVVLDLSAVTRMRPVAARLLAAGLAALERRGTPTAAAGAAAGDLPDVRAFDDLPAALAAVVAGAGRPAGGRP